MGKVFFFGTILGLGGEGNNNAPWWRFVGLLYVYTIFTFLSAQWLIGLSRRKQVSLGKQTQLGLVLMQFGACVYVGLQDLWINPGFKQYFSTAFHGAVLPDITHVCLYVIPAGTFTSIVTLLWIINVWLLYAKTDGSDKMKDWFHLTFVGTYLAIYVLIPLSILCPFL